VSQIASCKKGFVIRDTPFAIREMWLWIGLVVGIVIGLIIGIGIGFSLYARAGTWD
jgi:hypothetical protein